MTQTELSTEDKILLAASKVFTEKGFSGARTRDIAEEAGIQVHDGIYVGLQGPTFETLAEYGMVTRLGGDCVGMSTVPEVIVARHMDLETFGISVITDMGNEESIGSISHDEVLEAAKGAEPKVRSLIRELILNY